MRRTTLLLSISCGLMLAGCGQAGSGSDSVGELQNQVTAMQEQNRDLRTKIAARQAITGDPLHDFFNAPEFWQCTYDSAWADCAARCTKATKAGYEACLANHPVGPERKACVEENAARGGRCLQECPKPTLDSGVPRCV